MDQETTAGAEQAPEPEEGDLRDALARAAEAESRAESLLGQLQRLKADFDNYRRRMMQEQARWQEAAVAAFVQELLPVLDNLERALASSRGDDAVRAAEALRQGLELTLRQFRLVLERSGLTAIEAVGQPFDPTRHEAMMRVEDPGYAGDTVVEEFQKGYIFKGQVLRPSLVKVAVAPSGSAAESEPGAAAEDRAREDRSGGGE